MPRTRMISILSSRNLNGNDIVYELYLKLLTIRQQNEILNKNIPRESYSRSARLTRPKRQKEMKIKVNEEAAMVAAAGLNLLVSLEVDVPESLVYS